MSSLLDAYSTRPSAPDPYRDRRPPQSEDAEQSVLAAMLIDAEAITRATEIVDDTMFFREGHRRIFRAIISLVERLSGIDVVTLSDELERRGELDAAGGREYLSFLADAVPTAANVEHHSRIVKEKALLRRLIEVSTQIAGEAFEARLPAGELIDFAEQRILEVGHDRGGEGFVRVKKLTFSAMERIESISRDGRSVTGVASGFSDLDQLTSGFQPSDLVIVAARPSMGKTALTLNIAQNVAIKEDVGVAFFSLEMSKESLVQRMLTSEARLDAQAIRTGRLRDDDWPRLARAAAMISQAPIYIDDSPGLTVLEMRAKSRRLKADPDSKLGLIVVDYLQLMTGPSAENRQQEVSQISRGLKALAKELRVPVVALSQLSRAPEQRSGDEKGRPQLSDLRESGAIEQDADLILFIFRQEVYAERDESGRLKNSELDGKAEIIIGKQRNGPIGTVPLFFHKQYTRFENFSRRQQGE
jgi:replicative DNA helicase